jgi:hypothetical protein
VVKGIRPVRFSQFSRLARTLTALTDFRATALGKVDSAIEACISSAVTGDRAWARCGIGIEGLC